MKIVLILFAVVIILVLSLSYICFYLTFYVRSKDKLDEDEYSIPPGKAYLPHRDTMVTWMKELKNIPYRPVEIKSFDGLILRGKYYECKPGAVTELMFHGYRGNSRRDLCGGVQRCFALGRNVLVVDQRAAGKSDGHVISFGINESRDCVSWVDFMIKEFGNDIRIIITGISMGAATVMMATARDLPENVIGVLADCGYTSPKEIIKKTIKKLKLPQNVLYPFVRLGAFIFGRFDLHELSPIEAMKQCKIPVIFFHGETDDFVPCEMSIRNYEACNSRKMLVTVPDAEHGLSYIIDSEGYLQKLREFFS